MKYDISELFTGKVSSIEIDDYLNVDLKELGIDSFTADKIHIKGSIFKTTVLGLELTYESNWKTECARCLKRVDYHIEGNIKRSIVKKFNDIDDESVLVESDVIDLTDLIVDDIILNLPTQIICSESCKGLCMKCGVNLNEEDCECDIENIDPRLSKLKDLFK